MDIYVADTSGSAPVDVTASSAAADSEPRWSPDGTKIAFDSDRGGNVDVYAMNPDGSGVTDLTPGAGDDTLGDWSPDSQRIVFSSTRTGGGDLYVMSRTGSPVTRLTSVPRAETHAAWSPDGTTIAFSSDADGDNEVYRIAPDGSGLLKVTNNSTEDVVQDWQALHDTSAPRVHALKSTGRRGGTGRFRFTIQEDSGTASIEVEYSYRTRNGTAGGFGSQTLRHIRAGHVYGIAFRTKELTGAPKSFRFCVTGTDASVNIGKRSCARFYLLPKKKKKKR
jgi:Tol biopolymer transport system component